MLISLLLYLIKIPIVLNEIQNDRDSVWNQQPIERCCLSGVEICEHKWCCTVHIKKACSCISVLCFRNMALSRDSCDHIRLKSGQLSGIHPLLHPHNYFECAEDDPTWTKLLPPLFSPKPWIVNKKCAWSNILSCVFYLKENCPDFGLKASIWKLLHCGKMALLQGTNLHLMVFCCLWTEQIHVYRSMSKLLHFSFIFWNNLDRIRLRAWHLSLAMQTCGLCPAVSEQTHRKETNQKRYVYSNILSNCILASCFLTISIKQPQTLETGCISKCTALK